MLRTVLRVTVAAALVVAFAGCASSGSAGGGGGRAVLTRAQLLETNEPDLYRAVERLRPQWLRPRGQGSPSGATVVTLFLDGSPRGSVAEMRGMLVDNVDEVTYYSASEAAFQFGTIAGSGGSVAVRSRR